MKSDIVPVPWTPLFLPRLIKAYAVIDGGARLALRQETALRGSGPVCRKGCSQCCSRGDAPVSALELAGALWHASRRVGGEACRIVTARLAGDARGAGCPFLLDGDCAVHSMRFASCRQQFVFGRPCLPGEDPAMTRRADVFTPMRRFALRGFSIMAEAMGVDAGKDSPQRLDVVWRSLCVPVKNWSVPDVERFLFDVVEGRASSLSRLAA
ncbi:hypothetical protein JCM15519_35560 [Fundidesulfovibrio butyratiphilus]